MLAMNSLAQSREFIKSETGLSVTEYAVAAALVAATLAATFGNLGLTVEAMLVSLVAFL